MVSQALYEEFLVIYLAIKLLLLFLTAKVKLVSVIATKAYKGVAFHKFLTSALDGDETSRLSPIAGVGFGENNHLFPLLVMQPRFLSSPSRCLVTPSAGVIAVLSIITT
jgi:hypothetical protein